MNIQEQVFTRYDNLKSICQIIWEPNDLERIEKAFLFAKSIVGENRFKHNEVIINHSLEVATIIAQEIGMGTDSIVAGLLHNVMYAGLDRKATQNEIETNFGKHIYFILDGMAKINALGTDTVDIHSENYRKLLLALAGDVRVIILKIADRLQVLRNLDAYDADSQKRLVTETAYLYAPLAHRLGLYACKLRIARFMFKISKT